MADPYSIIAAYPNAGEGFLRGMQQGQQLQQQQRIRDAMAALSGRNDPNALRSLYAADPKLGMEMETTIGKREDRQREADTRAALAAYITGGDGSATGGVSAPTASGAPPTSPGMGDAAATAAALDPEKFITVAGKKSNITKTQLETSIKVHDTAMQILGGVHDDASLQAAKQEARALYQQYGGDPSFIDQIPDTYDPKVIHDLELRGMDTSHQLNALAHENDVGSLITTRAATTAEHIRHDQASEANVQRGQNISSADRQRGQNLAHGPKGAPSRPATPSTVIGGIMAKQAAGQPLTAQEQQLYNDYRTAKKRGGGSAPVRVNSVAEARALAPGTLFITPDGTVKRR
jgi:hypothetical protein